MGVNSRWSWNRGAVRVHARAAVHWLGICGVGRVRFVVTTDDHAKVDCENCLRALRAAKAAATALPPLRPAGVNR